MVRTSPFHGGNMGSSPVGITNTKNLPFGSFFVLVTVRLEDILPGQYGPEENKQPQNVVC